MSRFALRHLPLALIAAPLALALASCGGDKKEAGGLSGEAIEKVAAPAGKAWGDVIVKTPEGGYLMGNPDAPIKVLEFGSLTCSHCAEFAEASSVELRDTFVASGRVSFEFRNFVRDPIDITAAQIIRCAAPESFFALTDQAFANQAEMFAAWQNAGEARVQQISAMSPESRGSAIADAAGLSDFFAARGLSKDQVATCLAKSADAKALADGAQKAGEDYDIQGTPTFVINGQKADVSNWAEVKARLETMGAR